MLQFGIKNHNDQGIEIVTSLEELPVTTVRYLRVSIEFKALSNFHCLWIIFLDFDTIVLFIYLIL